ncbi:MAG: ribonuclease P protein subunit [Nitrososphaera sp.]|nr:ribonuclease P protein subunit [Nitrososphaera sp.]
MTVTRENLLANEITGLEVRVLASTDPSLCNLRGIIVLETKHTLSIRTESNAIKKIAKNAVRKMELLTDSGVCFISGSSLIGRAEDRISRLN